jgi:beta-lactamase superfamily II metal-dependent hydrolase
MSTNHVGKFVGIGLLVLAFACPQAVAQAPVMRAHFIDVGQGDATLLEFPCGAILIDAGAQDDRHADHLADYVRRFFARRDDLNNTLASVIITHPHVDHTRSLYNVSQVCRIARYIDGAILNGSGENEVRWIRRQVSTGMMTTVIREVRDSQITALPNRSGFSDGDIDPLTCADCDPRIVILSASHQTNPGWPNEEFRDANNHSLVVRVDFGEASFLFTGDLEVPAIETLIDYYRNTNLLDVDVYQVGHHGSANGTTPALLNAMTPSIAVFGVGEWDYGRFGGAYTTYRYGHPRRTIVNQIAAAIPGNRSQPRFTRVFDGMERPRNYTVRKRMYATGWDGDITIQASLDGAMRVTVRDWEDDPVDAPPSVAAALPADYVPSLPYDSVSPDELIPDVPSCQPTCRCCRRPRLWRCFALLRRCR